MEDTVVKFHSLHVLLVIAPGLLTMRFALQDNVYMHLTNYAINKNSEDFVRDDEAGSKR